MRFHLLVWLPALALTTACQSASAPPPSQSSTPIGGPEVVRTAASTTFRIGHAGSPSSLFEQDAQAFLALVQQRTGGAVKGQSFPGGQLANQQEMVEQVQIGQLEMVVSSSEFTSAVPEFGVFDLPFAFTDRAQIKRAIESQFGAELTALALKRNLVIVGFWENGFRHITNNKRPIRTPADLAGLRIRTPPNLDRVRMFHAWGAEPAPLDLSELFGALQAGVFDGQENPLAQITSMQLFQVQRYLSLSGHVYTPTYLVASRIWWEGIDPEIQQVMREAAAATGDSSRARGESLDGQGQALVRQAGMEVNDGVDKAAFERASVSLYDDYQKRFGSALLQRLAEAKAA
jgi:TRAP-type transport system periplasmic protein